MKQLEAEAEIDRNLNFVMYTTKPSKILNRGRRCHIATHRRGHKDRIEASGSSWRYAINSLRDIVEKRQLLQTVMSSISIR